MPSVTWSVLFIAAFLLPGSIVTQLSRRRRGHVAASQQLEVLLQALGWAVVVHVCFLWWTAHLYGAVSEKGIASWASEVWAIALYAVVVLILTPAVIGMLLNRVLRKVESRSKPPGPLWEALGAGGSPQAWDKLSRGHAAGGFVVARTKDGLLVAGKLGKDSWVSLSPGRPDMLLEEAWWTDELGNPQAPFVPSRSVWLNAVELEYLHFIDGEVSQGDAEEEADSQR